MSPIASSKVFQCLIILLGGTLISSFMLLLFLQEDIHTTDIDTPTKTNQQHGGGSSFSSSLPKDLMRKLHLHNMHMASKPKLQSAIELKLKLKPNGNEDGKRRNKKHAKLNNYDTTLPLQLLDYKQMISTLEEQDHKNEDRQHRPSMIGIALHLYRFLDAFAESNKKLMGDMTHDDQKTSNNKMKAKHQPSPSDIHASYISLASEHLLALDQLPTFPIRNDDSIFISVAAYREHLLADTLRSAFRHATHPEKIRVGVVVQNCNHDNCNQKNMNSNGERLNDADENGVDIFCSDPEFTIYCNNHQIRPLYVNESESIGPAVARYYASKLWGGETYFIQIDSHLKFAQQWDELYISDLHSTLNYPKSILSTYPPGFINFRQEPPYTPSNRLCRCHFSKGEGNIVRIEMEGKTKEGIPRPTQMAFSGAGLIVARAELLQDVPYDPFLPWLFMGEEIAFSMRSWTSGWNIYAPTLNLIGHHYRPLNLGLPHYWDEVDEMWQTSMKRMSDKLMALTRNRIKHLVGYPDRLIRKLPWEQGKHDHTKHGSSSSSSSSIIFAPEEFYNITFGLEYYGLGHVRSMEDYLGFAEIDFETETCGPLKWCSDGSLE